MTKRKPPANPGRLPAPHAAGAGTLCLAEAAEGTAIFAQQLGFFTCCFW